MPTQYTKYAPGTVCKAVKSFKTEYYDELSLSVGDLIVIEQPDPDEIKSMKQGYIKGVNRDLGPMNGRNGFFPADCVEADGDQPDSEQFQGISTDQHLLGQNDDFNDVDQQPDENQLKRKDSADSSIIGSYQDLNNSFGAEQYGDIALLNEQIDQQDQLDNSGDQSSLLQQQQADLQYVEEMQKQIIPGMKVAVRFPYEAQKSDELELKMGDVAVVTHCPPGGWWRGALWTKNEGLGTVGWFPANFVEILPQSEQADYPPASNNKTRKDSVVSVADDESTRPKKKFWQRKASTKLGITELISGKLTERHEEEDGTDNQGSQGDGDDSQHTPNSEQYGSLTKKSINMFKRLTTQGILPSVMSGGSTVGSRESKVVSRQISTQDFPQIVVAVPSQQALEVMNSPQRPEKKSWKDGMSENEVEKLGIREQKRQQVIWELFITEGAYVRDLKMVIEVFMRPMVDKRLLTVKNVEIIFGNLEKILGVNEQFYKHLERIYDSSSTIDSFGSMFIEYCDQFFAYTMYCSNNAKALTKVKDLTSTNKTLAKFLNECYQIPATRHLDLSSYLIKPVQRICKYPLFLLEIIKATSGAHPDRTNLEIALAKLQNVLMVINEGVDGLQRIVEIQNAFAEKIELSSPTRYLIREDHLSIFLPPPESRQKPRQIFLFNDMVLIAKKDWREKYHSIASAEIECVTLNEFPGDKQNIFELIFLDQQTYEEQERFTVVANNKEQKANWIQAWKNLTSSGILSRIPEKSVVNLTALDSTQKSSGRTSTVTDSLREPGDLSRNITVRSKNPLNNSALKSSRIVMNASKLSLASAKTAGSKEGRLRSSSLNNESAKHHQAIARELLDKHAILARSKARSLSDVNADEDVIVSQSKSQAEVQKSASLQDDDDDAGDKGRYDVVPEMPGIQITVTSPTSNSMNTLHEPVEQMMSSSLQSSAFDDNKSPQLAQSTTAVKKYERVRKYSVGKDDYDSLKAKLEYAQMQLSQKEDLLQEQASQILEFQSAVSQNELQAASYRLKLEECGKQIVDLKLDLSKSVSHALELEEQLEEERRIHEHYELDMKQKYEAELSRNKILLQEKQQYDQELAAKMDHISKELSIEKEKNARKSSEISRLVSANNELENELVELQKELMERSDKINVLTEKLQLTNPSWSSLLEKKEKEINLLRSQLLEVDEKYKQSTQNRSRLGSMDKLSTKPELRTTVSMNNVTAAGGESLMNSSALIQKLKELEQANSRLSAIVDKVSQGMKDKICQTDAKVCLEQECQTDSDLLLSHVDVQSILIQHKAEMKSAKSQISTMNERLAMAQQEIVTSSKSIKDLTAERNVYKSNYEKSFETFDLKARQLQAENAALATELEKRKQQSNSELLKLQQEFESLNTDYQEQERELAQALMDLQDQKSLVAVIESEKAEVSELLKKAMIELDQQRSQVKRLDASLDEALKERVNLVNSYEGAVKSLRDELDDNDEKIVQQKNENNQLLQQIRQNRSQFDQAVATHKSQIEMITSAFQEKRLELTTWQEKFNTLQSSFAKLQDDYKSEQQFSNELKAEFQSVLEKNGKLQKSIDEYQAEITESQSSILKLKSQIGILNRASSQANSLVDQIRRECSVLQTDVEAKNTKIEKLELLLSKESAEVKEVLLVENKDLYSKLQEQQKQLTQTEHELSQVRVEMENQLSDSTDASLMLQNQVQTLSTKVQNLEHQVETKQLALISVNNSKSEIEQQYEESRSRLSELQVLYSMLQQGQTLQKLLLDQSLDELTQFEQQLHDKFKINLDGGQLKKDLVQEIQHVKTIVVSEFGTRDQQVNSLRGIIKDLCLSLSLDPDTAHVETLLKFEVEKLKLRLSTLSENVHSSLHDDTQLAEIVSKQLTPLQAQIISLRQVVESYVKTAAEANPGQQSLNSLVHQLSNDYTKLMEQHSITLQKMLRDQDESKSQMQILQDGLEIAKMTIQKLNQNSVLAASPADYWPHQITQNSAIAENLSRENQKLKNDMSKLKKTVRKHMDQMSQNYLASVKNRERDILFLRNEIKHLLQYRSEQ
ncbi:hypothetical protein MP228_008983 [Amoeboaphelidium protococcarum]|nr:hypothetical protein MP228_008983 [Amoeboaphelidium protococcarum]